MKARIICPIVKQELLYFALTFINTAAYHVGCYKPSPPLTIELHEWPYAWVYPEYKEMNNRIGPTVMYEMLPWMCCIIFGVCHKYNGLPIVPIRPSYPSSKEHHVAAYWIKIWDTERVNECLYPLPSISQILLLYNHFIFWTIEFCCR